MSYTKRSIALIDALDDATTQFAVTSAALARAPTYFLEQPSVVVAPMSKFLARASIRR